MKSARPSHPPVQSVPIGAAPFPPKQHGAALPPLVSVHLNALLAKVKPQ